LFVITLALLCHLHVVLLGCCCPALVSGRA